MKNIFSLLLALLLIQQAGAQAVTFPVVEQYELSNGLKVYLIEYGEIPGVSVSLFVNCGKKNETPGQQYYSQLAASCINFGNEKYKVTDMEDKLYRMGASIEAVAGDNYTTVSSSFLNADLDEGLDVYSSAILHPTFPDGEIQQFISEVIDYNNPAKLDIGEQASIFSNFWIYGSSNPFGRYFYRAQLSKVTTAAIKEFYQFNYTPGNARLVICGKIDKATLKPLIEKYFGGWTAPYGEVNGVSFDLPVIRKKEYAFVNRNGATQAALRWTKSAPDAKSKDVIPFMIANAAFNDVLVKEIREKGGKTYSIASSFDPYNNSRLFDISTQVRQKEMAATATLFDSTLASFYNSGITQQQMNKAVMSLKNEWLMLEQPEDIIHFFDPYIYPKPEDRMKYIDDLNKLTLAEVNKIIKKYFTPDVYKLMIAGDQQNLSEQLKQFSQLKTFTPKDIEVDQ